MDDLLREFSPELLIKYAIRRTADQYFVEMRAKEYELLTRKELHCCIACAKVDGQ